MAVAVDHVDGAKVERALPNIVTPLGDQALASKRASEQGSGRATSIHSL
jgi:hypothetical protein